MELSGSYTFDAPRQVVWEALMDPQVLASVMPGCEKMEKTGENEYDAALKIKVGPVQGNFNGKVTLLDINEPDSYTMRVNGKGPAGFMHGEGAVRLEADGNATNMYYTGKAQVGGKIASVGQGLLDSSAKALTRQSLDGLHKQIKARVQLGSTAGEAANGETAAPQAAIPPPAAGPSQTEFAVGGAKNMLDDVLPSAWRPVVIVIALIILAIILYAIIW